MNGDTIITYINQSENPDQPSIYIFSENHAPSLDIFTDKVAWRVLKDIGKGSSSEFVYPVETTVRAVWDKINRTNQLVAQPGKRYSVIRDNTGIVLVDDGKAADPETYEVQNSVEVEGGIDAQLCKDGLPYISEHNVAFNQKAVFLIKPIIYWGVASEILEAQMVSSAVIPAEPLMEMDLEGVTSAVVTLTGNPKNGYQFSIEKQI